MSPDRSTQLECALVVVAWNGRDWIDACLSHALAQAQVRHEVIVVDNASSDGTATFVRERYPGVRVIESESNRGFAGGVNLGVGATSTPYVGLVNQDAYLDRRWCRQSLLRFRTDERIAVVGGKVLYPDRVTLQHAGGRFNPPLFLTDHRGYGKRDTGEFDEATDVDYVTGAALMLRRDVFERLGGFDEAFSPAYFEEADYCARAREAGYRVVYEPFAVAIHHESASTVRNSAQYYEWFHRNRIRYLLKHLPGDEILNVFRPAERRRLAWLESDDEARALLEAYRAGKELIGSGQIVPPGTRPDRAEDAARSLDELTGLAEARVRGEEVDPIVSYLGEVRRYWRIEEPGFASRAPVVGRLVARFRKFWNDVATAEYLRPIVAQQRTWNEWSYQTMHELHTRVAELKQAVEDDRWRRSQREQDLPENLGAALRRLEEAVERAQEVAVQVDRDAVRITRLVGQIDARLRALERAYDRDREPAGTESAGPGASA